jgi:hypothetical protein
MDPATLAGLLLFLMQIPDLEQSMRPKRALSHENPESTVPTASECQPEARRPIS